jgi:hypothetical protein
VDYWAETDLAWELAGAVAPRIPNRDSAELYAAIGAGDAYTGLVKLLEIVVSTRVPLGPELVIRIADWLDAYTHSDDGPRLRELLATISTLR